MIVAAPAAAAFTNIALSRYSSLQIIIESIPVLMFGAEGRIDSTIFMRSAGIFLNTMSGLALLFLLKVHRRAAFQVMDESEILKSSATPHELGGDKIGGSSNHSALASSAGGNPGTGHAGSSNSSSKPASSGSHSAKVEPAS